MNKNNNILSIDKFHEMCYHSSNNECQHVCTIKDKGGNYKNILLNASDIFSLYKKFGYDNIPLHIKEVAK